MIFTHSFRFGIAAAVCTLALVFANVLRADGGFSSELSKADYEAAGLKKLSADQRARLDALVSAYAAGNYAKDFAASPTTATATATATPAATTTEKSTVNDETPVAANPPKPRKQKVKIDPGTEIEYNTMDTEMVGTFEGFENGTIITLTNGQRWKVVDGSYVCGPDTRVKKVRVKPGVLGSFFLEFEKVSVRAKVQLIK